MAAVGRSQRAGSAVVAGRARAAIISRRLGTALREARLAAGMTQAQLAERARLSQPFVSQLERGGVLGAGIDTWAVAAAATGEQFVGFLEHAPGADLPRDIEHLRRQQLVVEFAARGGWRSLPEEAVDEGTRRSRSIDVLLVRSNRREAAVVEVWDWFDDVGAAMRSLDGKTATLARRFEAGPPGKEWRVGGLWVVRGTRRNRALVGELRGLFAAKFRGSSERWLAALRSPEDAMPNGNGLLWTAARLDTLMASRIRRGITGPGRRTRRPGPDLNEETAYIRPTI